MINDLYRDTTFKSYQELVNQINLKGKRDFWKYLQLWSRIGSVFRLNRGEEEDNMVQDFFNLQAIIQHYYLLKAGNVRI